MDFKDIKKVIRFIKGLTNYGFLNLDFARNKIKKENLPTLLQESYDAIALLGFLYKEDYLTYDEVEQKFKLDVYKLSAVILEGATGSFTGNVTATSGYIGTEDNGWIIGSSNLSNGDVYLGTNLFGSGVTGISIDGNIGADAHNYMATVSGNAYFELGDGSNKVFKYDSSTGDLTFKGGIFDGDITCNGTITGGTIRTSDGDDRIEISNDKILFYGNNKQGVYLDGRYISPYYDLQFKSPYSSIVPFTVSVKEDGDAGIFFGANGGHFYYNGSIYMEDVEIIDTSRNATFNSITNNGTTVIDSSGNIITPSWLKFDYDSGGDYTIHPLSNGILRYQDYGHDYTVNEIRSAGDVTADDMEATLTLQRNNDAETNAEFLDLFNNGYQGVSMEMGVKIQKRGTGSYRDFVIQYGDGTTTFDILRIDADDSFKVKSDKQIVSNGFDNTGQEFKNTNTTSTTTYSIGSDDTTVFVHRPYYQCQLNI